MLKIDELLHKEGSLFFEGLGIDFILCDGCGGVSVPKRRLWRRLFESFGKTQDKLREFLSHLIRDGDGGSRRAAHRQEWFWIILPKQKGLGGEGETPHFI